MVARRAITVLVLAVAVAAASGAGAADRKNILYFVIDDFRSEMHEAYDQQQIKTPNLDLLAAGGLVFDNNYCQQAVCSASRNSFMSGRRPDTTQMWGNYKGSFRDVGPNWITMPEHFKKQGYTTLGGGKTYHPNSPPNWDEPKSWSQEMPYFPFQMQHCPYFTEKLGTWCALEGNYSQFYDHRLANATFAHLDLGQAKRAKDGSPFFVMAGIRRPHGPWKVPQRFWDLYNTSQIALARNMNYTTGAPDLAYFKTSFWRPPYDARGYPGTTTGNYQMYNTSINTPIDFEVQREARHAYYAAVSFMDYEVGRILQHLDKIGAANDTIVVLHGDHGYFLGENQMFHKFTCFEQTARTPLVIRAPFKPNSVGKRTPVLSELVDMYPTLAALAGTAKPTDALEGDDISAVFDDPTNVGISDAAFSQYPRCPSKQYPEWRNNGCGGGKDFVGFMGYTIRTLQYRYTAWVPFANRTGDWDAAPHAIELYPHQPKEPTQFQTETASLAGNPQYAPVIKSLHAKLRAQFERKRA